MLGRSALNHIFVFLDKLIEAHDQRSEGKVQEQANMTEQHHNSEIGVRFVSDEVKRDHRDLENLLAGLTADNNHDDDDDKTRDENASTSTTSQLGELQNRFCWGLVRHLIAMQLFVFPGTESRAKEGSLVAGNRQRESWVVS